MIDSRPFPFPSTKHNNTPVTRLFRPIRAIRSPIKPKGLPLLGERMKSSAAATDSIPDDPSSSSIPYRLPKLKPEPSLTPTEEDELYRVWGRHGYEIYASKPIELEQLVTQLSSTPRQVSQELRRANLSAAYPNFRDAIISPIRSKPSVYGQQYINKGTVVYHSGELQKPFRAWTDPDEVESEHYAPTLQTNSNMTLQNPKSQVGSAKSIHWELTQCRQNSLDPTGKRRAQGPYSREFTVHCSAPNNWLRLKFTRSKTMS